MIRRIVYLTFLLCFSVSAVAVTAGDVAPAFTGKDESGQTVSFPELIDGKPTVMVYWATWCGYCKAFMPYLAEIQRDYGDEKINVVIINHKERGAGDPVAYVNALDFEYTAVLDGDSIGDAYKIDFIPGLLIIDERGSVAWRRKSTDLPAGRQVAEYWDSQVRQQLDTML